MPDVTLVACAKNEGPYLLEWIAHHGRLGFAEIVIYDNGSTDGSRDILAGLAAAGRITFRNQPDRPFYGPQPYAYRDAIGLVRTPWIAFLDLDELLVLDPGLTVPDLVARFDPDVAQIAFNWRIFGSSGRIEPGEGLMLERFLRASRPDRPGNAHVKTITRADRIAHVDVHAPHLTDGRIVHADGTPFRFQERYGLSAEIRHGTGRVHHYAIKSRAEFDSKIARGRGTVGTGRNDEKQRVAPDRFFASHDLNDVLCDELLGEAEAVRAGMRRLAADLAAIEASIPGRLRRRWIAWTAGFGQRWRIPGRTLAIRPGGPGDGTPQKRPRKPHRTKRTPADRKGPSRRRRKAPDAGV